ncbi:MAG: N-acetyl-alpha-D-glucosaminyl L-malate synthase BshA [Bacteroidia bacterium]|nr:N-acetyl-alpha-D-glucosaminyl L-malate synthase BshA [Bacteroidia bacterium]MDW8302759.1 N-acetyl-alpha-D-glucosaminyl L-malate synthase BshA [Bacteroidia bacterium]
MKVGIVCYPTYGGSGVVATELGKALAEKGHEVHFITYDRPVRLEDFFCTHIYYHEVNVNAYPLFDYKPYETALSSRIVDVVKFQKLDILHVHYAIPHAACAYIAQQILKSIGIYIPFITTLHGTDITIVGRDASVEPVVTFSILQSDSVTAVSHFLKQSTYQNFPHTQTKPIEVIYNFVDTKRFYRKKLDHFKKAIAPHNEPIITHSSNFRKVKNVDDIVRAFDLIRKQMPAKLLLIGDGPERTNIEHLCRELGNCGDIRFLGKQDAIEDILSISDLFLLPSSAESFGLAALEAMACGVPVVATRIGGIPELVQHGETGYLIQEHDIEQLAQRSLEILQNPALHQAFSKNAYQRALVFDKEKIVVHYERLYESVLEKVACSNL